MPALQVILINAYCGEHRQTIHVAKIEKSIKVSSSTTHLAPDLCPRSAAGFGQLPIRNAPLLYGCLLQELEMLSSAQK